VSCYRCFGACECYGIGREDPEPASHCSSLELDGEPEGRWRLRAVVTAVFFVVMFGVVFSLVMGCATVGQRRVSRSYEICHMACERVGCSRADTAQVCAVAEVLP
jgi:hypothetical protein